METTEVYWVAKLQERPLGITGHLPSFLTDKDIEKPSVDMISLRPKTTKYSNQGKLQTLS